jgi:hypothetical protein
MTTTVDASATTNPRLMASFASTTSSSFQANHNNNITENRESINVPEKTVQKIYSHIEKKMNVNTAKYVTTELLGHPWTGKYKQTSIKSNDGNEGLGNGGISQVIYLIKDVIFYFLFFFF